MNFTTASGTTIHRFEVGDLTGGDDGIEPEDAELCARLIARYAKDPADGDMLADALGIDEGVRTWDSQRLADRIMQIADSVPVRREPGQMIAPQLRYQRARHTKGRHS